MVDHNEHDAQRLDIYLYRTRLLKTRALASRMISKGKVRLTRNGVTERIKKPHTLVRPGDGISFMRGQTLLDLTVTAIPERRGPAQEAQSCYTRYCEDKNGPETGPETVRPLDKSGVTRQSAGEF